MFMKNIILLNNFILFVLKRIQTQSFHNMINDIVNNYERLVMNIGQLIEVSGYRNDYIAKKLGLTNVNFSAKKNRRTFTVEEIKQIASIIDNEDVNDFLMMQEMDQRKDDETISHDELYKLMGWK